MDKMQLLLLGWNGAEMLEVYSTIFLIHTICNYEHLLRGWRGVDQSGNTVASLCRKSCSEGNLMVRVFAADKPHSTCSLREIREDVLLLSQQLWQNCSPSLNLVCYRLIVIS